MEKTGASTDDRVAGDSAFEAEGEREWSGGRSLFSQSRNRSHDSRAESWDGERTVRDKDRVEILYC